MSSIKDVAKRAGVSIGTVSNVINKTRYVSPERVERVCQAIEDLNFTINPIASSLRGKRTNTIGIVATNITSVFYSHIITGMQRAALENGFTLTIFSTYNSLAAEKEGIERLKSNFVDAIVIDTSADLADMDYFINLSTLKNNDKLIPVMSIEVNLLQYGISSVFVDGMKASGDATSHLIEKGCKRIVHIMGPGTSGLSRERLIGYKKALIGAGYPIVEENILSGDFSQQSGYSSMMQYLEKGLSPDGIFAANDQMAIGACRAVLQKGLKIPDDVKVVGYDDSFVASIVRPSLTTINVPKEEMGYQAISELAQSFKDVENYKPRQICLPTKLTIRETTEKNVIIENPAYYW